jgi:hypothetical protein
LDPEVLPARLQRHIVVDLKTGCWRWTGASTKGYGQVTYRKRHHLVHRLVWELLIGPVAPSMQLDHVCRVRRCCRPLHLREVTALENVHAPGSQSISAIHAKKTHCPAGHPYDDANTYRPRRGGRLCRECNRQRKKGGA